MFRNLITIVLFTTTAIVCLSASVNAQQPSPEISTVKGDGNAGELNSAV